MNIIFFHGRPQAKKVYDVVHEHDFSYVILVQFLKVFVSKFV